MGNEKANATENNDASVSKEPTNKHPESVPGMLEVGAEVSIKKTTLTGRVSGYHLSADSKVLSYLVEYEEDGVSNERGFLPNQINAKEVTDEN